MPSPHAPSTAPPPKPCSNQALTPPERHLNPTTTPCPPSLPPTQAELAAARKTLEEAQGALGDNGTKLAEADEAQRKLREQIGALE